MDSLNGYTIEEVKKEISKQVKYDISDIRLFGSRITGGWKDKSDLDVVIRDVNKVDYGISYGNYLGINCEIRFVEDFEISWLRDSV
jgi:predicted nucleotidyltransferase